MKRRKSKTRYPNRIIIIRVGCQIFKKNMHGDTTFIGGAETIEMLIQHPY
jgi:hypothetical protein